MVEKVITLDNVSLVDFLGVANNNINTIADAFPKSKIISRGNEIHIKGSTHEIIRINDILTALIDHYHRFGKITEEQVTEAMADDRESQHRMEDDDVIVFGTRGIVVRPKTANQKKLVQAVHKYDLVFATGPAGTGKTYMAVAMAVRALKNKEVRKIIITRPAVEAGENLGFLPGDLKEKIDPYLRPIYDALMDMVPMEKLRYYQENQIIEIAPLAYMRGRTLNNAFILLDEAQNTTPMQIKMFLTRMGPNSKVIVTGDMSQVDLPKKQKSGLVDSIQILEKIQDIGFVYLDARDVTRHPLVREIVKAFDIAEEKNHHDTGKKDNR